MARDLDGSSRMASLGRKKPAVMLALGMGDKGGAGDGDGDEHSEQEFEGRLADVCEDLDQLRNDVPEGCEDCQQKLDAAYNAVEQVKEHHGSGDENAGGDSGSPMEDSKEMGQSGISSGGAGEMAP